MLSGILTQTSLYSINLRIMGRPNTPLLNQPTIYSAISDVLSKIWPSFPTKYTYIIFFVLFALLIKILLDSFLKTQMGFALRATGDNPQMIRSQGVDTNLSKILGLTLSNGLIALSGALVAQYQGFADVGMGVGTIVAGLASVIIGDSLFGKKRFISTLGVLFGSFYTVLALLCPFLPVGTSLGFKITYCNRSNHSINGPRFKSLYSFPRKEASLMVILENVQKIFHKILPMKITPW